jgi:hypothetical protein
LLTVHVRKTTSPRHDLWENKNRYFTFSETPTNITILSTGNVFMSTFPRGDCPRRGDWVKIGPFANGTKVGFWARACGNLGNTYGTRYSINGLNSGGRQRSVQTMDGPNYVFGFDNDNGLDFNDAGISVKVESAIQFGAAGDAAPTMACPPCHNFGVCDHTTGQCRCTKPMTSGVDCRTCTCDDGESCTKDTCQNECLVTDVTSQPATYCDESALCCSYDTSGCDSGFEADGDYMCDAEAKAGDDVANDVATAIGVTVGVLAGVGFLAVFAVFLVKKVKQDHANNQRDLKQQEQRESAAMDSPVTPSEYSDIRADSPSEYSEMVLPGSSQSEYAVPEGVATGGFACHSCSATLPPGSRFCDECGQAQA